MYERAKDASSGLKQEWLDNYYGFRSSNRGVMDIPNHYDISLFLYSDCRPAPPCACKTADKDAASAADCLSSLVIYLANPANVVPADVMVSSFVAQATGSQDLALVAEWARQALPEDTCQAFAAWDGAPYKYQPLGADNLARRALAGTNQQGAAGAGELGSSAGAALLMVIAVAAVAAAVPMARAARQPAQEQAGAV